MKYKIKIEPAIVCNNCKHLTLCDKEPDVCELKELEIFDPFNEVCKDFEKR